MMELLCAPSAGESRSSHRSGIAQTHLALTVDSVNSTTVELERRDAKIILPPIDIDKLARWVAFFVEPWDNLFEVIEEASW